MKKLLCVAIMVKDEEDRIIRTLDTIIKHVCHVVILDTGSTDNTVSAIKKFCDKKKKPLKIDIMPFVDFSYSRNVLLKMCYGLSQYVLLLDSNDEVVNPQILVNFLNQVNDKRDCVFGCKFCWENDAGIKGNDRTYYKIGIIRNNISDIYYEFPVHEYITSSNPRKYISNNNLQLSNFYIYQDRSKDKSSVPRIKKDIIILNKYINENGDNIRAYRFLCQSYNILRDYDNLYKSAKKLLEMVINSADTSQYDDNYYYGLMTLGHASHKIGLNISEVTKYYLKAYQHAKLSFDNCEPLYELATIHKEEKNLEMAYYYIKKCVDIPIPKNVFTTQINNKIYETHRWALLLVLSEGLGCDDDYKLACKNLYGRDDMIPLNNMISKSDTSKLNEKQKEEILKLNQLCERTVETNVEAATIKEQEILRQNSQGYMLYLIVPYRDRVKQLVNFIPYMNKYFKQLEIDYTVIVCEQDDTEDFNKGMLINAAVKYICESDKNMDKIYLCIHDIDILPVKATNYYKPDLNNVNHLYGYNFCLGGIFLLNLYDFIKVNGFSNLYTGWGFEDNDFQRRIISNNIEINRDYFFIRGDKYCFNELDYDTSVLKMDDSKTKENQQIFEDNQILDEGYNTVRFDIDNYRVQRTIIRDLDTKEPYEFTVVKYKI